MGNQNKERDWVLVRIEGNKKIRQFVIDKIYELVMSDDFLADFSNPVGTHLKVITSNQPSEWVLP